MIVIIDNYDSFTYNLVQYFRELSVEVAVYRNNEITISGIRVLQPSHIVISPGPCTPDEAGISLSVVEAFAGKLPLLGVCLGHQAIAQVFGAKVVSGEQVMHGRHSAIYHDNSGVFAGLPNPFQGGRYHSLVIESQTLPDSLQVDAWTQLADGSREAIMGISHLHWPLVGVQFHPEAILTEHGHRLLNNFLQLKALQTV